MSAFLQDELGVAMSGHKWDIGNFRLWQSVRPDIVLFTPRQPHLAKGENGRYQVAVSQFRQQAESYKITGGTAVFTVTSALQYDADAFEALKEQWMNEMASVGPEPPRNPRFIPLNTQKAKAQVLINPQSGEPDEAHNDRDIGTPGGTNSFLVSLTWAGAQEWVQGIRQGTAIPAGVKMTYEYLRMLPDVGARVEIRAESIFTHFSASLNARGGVLFGKSAQIDAAWERMRREGDVKVTFIGRGLPPELEDIRQELVNTFIEQVQQRIFDRLFEPKPDVEDAQAGSSGGLFGGVNFAAKFRRVEDITNVSQTIRFKGWTWLMGSMDADLTALFSELDESYVTEVNTEMSFPASVVVDSDPQLETTAISWSASEGKAPETPVFGTDGGTASFLVTSSNPNDVQISYDARVNFVPSPWPIISTSGSAKVSEGGNQIVIKPASWIGRHKIYLFVRDGEEIVFDPNSDLLSNSYLVANVSYTGPHLSRPITASAKIAPSEPLTFSYPLSPTGERGTAKFSAFGAIGGRMVRASEVPINFDEEGVYILASPDSVQLVSEAAVVPESDRLATELMRMKGRPLIDDASSSPAEKTAPPPMYETTNSGSSERMEGTVVAVEYAADGPALLLELGPDRHKRVPLRDARWADTFDDERKRVQIQTDAQGYADRIRVKL